ncbi:hypothetical protein MT996_03845 [Ornithobacterium rhinotracheale]|uniref:hypothetical protein n=1 Tax=Ornithobacterium rhinotracheale TaxID=28251 RepID=UPI00129C92B6|nr:hypothetical protein [Ornithobacterium rhinotracheale]UOH78607.1 hypothetical protein MT996_03845 [Ornithobacterium rhinotracheale]
MKKTILGTTSTSLFPYSVIKEQTEKTLFRCIEKGNNTWGFRITQNLRERYEVDGVDYFFIVKLNEKGILEEIQVTFEKSKKEVNYNLVTRYGIEKKQIIIKDIRAEFKDPKTNNTMKIELSFSEN